MSIGTEDECCWLGCEWFVFVFVKCCPGKLTNGRAVKEAIYHLFVKGGRMGVEIVGGDGTVGLSTFTKGLGIVLRIMSVDMSVL